MINGLNVHTHKKEALASVSTLIETPEIYPSLTPKEALMMIAEIRGVPSAERNKRIEEALSQSSSITLTLLLTHSLSARTHKQQTILDGIYN